jgi:hypothetical protein
VYDGMFNVTSVNQMHSPNILVVVTNLGASKLSVFRLPYQGKVPLLNILDPSVNSGIGIVNDVKSVHSVNIDLPSSNLGNCIVNSLMYDL